jgi:hypothetical protein
MGVMKDLLESIQKSETMDEIEAKLNAFAGWALILERENKDLKARIAELETRV